MDLRQQEPIDMPSLHHPLRLMPQATDKEKMILVVVVLVLVVVFFFKMRTSYGYLLCPCQFDWLKICCFGCATDFQLEFGSLVFTAELRAPD